MDPLTEQHIGCFHQCLSEHLLVAQETMKNLGKDFSAMVHLVHQAVKNRQTVFFCGNGGSAADSQHLATELTVKFRNPRPALKAIALTTDTSALTAIGNDFGFDALFARQIEALGEKEDILIAISTSGKSPNIVAALKEAQRKGMKTIALTGAHGADVEPLSDLCLKVPSTTTARIQEMHIFLGQTLIEALEQLQPWGASCP